MDSFTDRYGSNNFKRGIIPTPFGKDSFITDKFELLPYTVNSYVQWDHFKDCNRKNSKYDFKILISGSTSIYGEDKWPQTDLKRMVQKEIKERLGLDRVAVYNLSLPDADNDWTARSIMNAYHILHPDFFIACWQPQENQYEYEKLQYMMDCFFLMIQRKYSGMSEHKHQRRTVDYHPLEIENEKRNYAPKVMKYINGHIERIKNMHFTKQHPKGREVILKDDRNTLIKIKDRHKFWKHCEEYHKKTERTTCYANGGQFTVNDSLFAQMRQV